MANQYTSTSTRGRAGSQDDDEDDDQQTSGQGRVKNPDADGRLKQNKDDDSTDAKSGTKTGGIKAGGTQAGGQMPAAQKRVMSRAVRVLNEIETRIHELREELEEKFGDAGTTGRPANGKQSNQHTSGRSGSQDDDEDDDSSSGSGNGKGAVKHPESDRRLKQNRDD